MNQPQNARMPGMHQAPGGGGVGGHGMMSDYDLMRQGSAESSHPSSELSLTDPTAMETALWEDRRTLWTTVPDLP